MYKGVYSHPQMALIPLRIYVEWALDVGDWVRVTLDVSGIAKDTPRYLTQDLCVTRRAQINKCCLLPQSWLQQIPPKTKVPYTIAPLFTREYPKTKKSALPDTPVQGAVLG